MTISIETLKKFIPFDEFSDSQCSEITKKLTLTTVPANKLIFKRGESQAVCNFLFHGSVDLCDKDFNITKINADDDDNFLALDNYPIHEASAITTTECTIASIDKDHLDLFLTWSEAFHHSNELPDDIDWMDSLLESDLFAKIPPANIQKLFSRFQEKSFNLGQKVVSEGDEGKSFFVIKSGKAIVTQKDTSSEKTLAALQTGDFFGEDSLISDTIRNASITMTSDGELMVLGKDDFITLLQEPATQHLTETELIAMTEDSDRGIVQIDVRTTAEFKNQRSAANKNIPLSELRESINLLESEFIYVLMCDGGRRSELGAYILSEAGLTSYVLDIPTKSTSATSE